MRVDSKRQIPASFERVARTDYGYNAKQVDQFLQQARVSLETPEAAAHPIKSADVRSVSFDPVKGGRPGIGPVQVQGDGAMSARSRGAALAGVWAAAQTWTPSATSRRRTSPPTAPVRQ